MRRWRSIPVALLAATILSLAVPLAAQDEAIYAREADWDVSRSEWGHWASNFEKNTQPVLEKLFADGVIVEWWFSATSLHSEDGYTHTTGYSATNLANLQHALDALVEAGSKQSEDERRAFAGAIRKHRDHLLRSVVYRSRAAKIEDGYFRSSSNQVKRGKGLEYREWWKKYIKPVYDELFDDGVISAYGLDEEYIHQTPGSVSGWYAVPDAEGLDKVDAAFAAAFGERTAEERSAIFGAVRRITKGHSDSLSRIIHYAVKEGSH